jgi:hypothetical protein
MGGRRNAARGEEPRQGGLVVEGASRAVLQGPHGCEPAEHGRRRPAQQVDLKREPQNSVFGSLTLSSLMSPWTEEGQGVRGAQRVSISRALATPACMSGTRGVPRPGVPIPPGPLWRNAGASPYPPGRARSLRLAESWRNCIAVATSISTWRAGKGGWSL